MKGIYYIENTINEFGSIITGYFSTIKDAKEALKECSDWFKPKGTGEMIEGLVEKKVSIKLTGEAIKNNEMVVSVDEYILPEGYIIKDENGNEILTSKIILEKKKKEVTYPKTYEECCKIIYSDPKFYVDTHLYSDTLGAIYKLLICRDAYCKIAGDEMGLGKPWESDWREERYIIYRNQDDIIGGYREAGDVEHHIFEFPTSEMRDAFKENFDPDIEICKDFL